MYEALTKSIVGLMLPTLAPFDQWVLPKAWCHQWHGTCGHTLYDTIRDQVRFTEFTLSQRLNLIGLNLSRWVMPPRQSYLF